ncbi:degenerin unc-8 [Aphelenchoides avenae]|nr:degenerin unc-8 [Aphelenchus avenae]
MDRSTHEGSDNGAGSADRLSTARASVSGAGALTTTSYETYLKDIKLNLNSDFSLSDLTPDQKRDLEALSDAYGLNPNNDVVVIDAVMKQALQTVAAKMSPELRQILGFQLKDLVSACIINGEPCEDSDFEQTFDVDYGNCYTFNYAQEPVKYIAKSCGTSHGLHMTIMANSSEQLASSVESGVKVVVHDQNLTPFPNVEGFKSATGQLASLISRFSRLGAPYGECSTLESIAKDKQPFYFNGTYSTEGCFRSCFQRNLATACGCADSRFPSPTDMDVPFCDPLDPPKYQCKEAYIQDNGDYFFVDNCDCYDACEDATYRTQISEAVWPSGTFFYGGFCPTAKQLNPADCTQFYSENGMTLEVSFAQLGYESLEEEPASTAWDLVNNLAGNTGLWIGYTMLSFTECILIAIQVALWVCRCPKELPEVPSCRHRNFFAEEDEDSSCDESSVEGDAATSVSREAAGGYGGKAEEGFDSLWAGTGTGSVISPIRIPPKNFDNSIHEKGE